MILIKTLAVDARFRLPLRYAPDLLGTIIEQDNMGTTVRFDGHTESTFMDRYGAERTVKARYPTVLISSGAEVEIEQPEVPIGAS